FAAALAQQRVRHGLRPAKTRYDSADGGNFYLRCRVAHQKHLALANLALHRNPLPVDGNPRPLPLERFHLLFLQEPLDALFGFLPASFTNDAQRSPRFVFGNQPVKIGSVIRHKPHPSRIARAVLWELDDGLHQRNRLDGRPTSTTPDARGCPVRAYDLIRMQFLVASCTFHFQPQSARIRAKAEKTRAEGKLSASL